MAGIKTALPLSPSHLSPQAFVDYHRELKGPKRMVGFTKYGSTDFWEPGAYSQSRGCCEEYCCYPAFKYCKGDWLIFGSETSGLPPEVGM